jgi:hypothetical protein
VEMIVKPIRKLSSLNCPASNSENQSTHIEKLK